MNHETELMAPAKLRVSTASPRRAKRSTAGSKVRHYNYFRSYSAERGRYTQADPIGLEGGFNRFGYVGGNPLGYTDPRGLITGVMPPWMWPAVLPMAGCMLSSGCRDAGKKIFDICRAAWNGMLSEEANDAEGSAEEGKPTRISNPKHHPNSISPEPGNVDELFNNSVPDKRGVRWVKDANGEFHRFSKPSNGESHWNGTTDPNAVDPIKSQNIDNDIKKLFGYK